MKHASNSSFGEGYEKQVWTGAHNPGLEWIMDLLVEVVVFFTRCSSDPTSDIDKEKHFKWVYLWVQMFMLLLVMYQEFVVCNVPGNCITNAENSTIFNFKSVSTWQEEPTAHVRSA